ncbi:MAG TPA: Sec-dependent nitrous-oxide reductase [Dehalococcoidia bacterium]|nr:Sec-dependent nitrous-oxide reductase [Dehalococcoidia bacterium]
MLRLSRLVFTSAALVLLAMLLGLGAACGDDDGGSADGDLQQIADERGLTPENMRAALMQYVPPGSYDDYVMIASGGHSGQMIVVGLPSMRILKVIGVFTPEPWQGYGYGEEGSDAILEGGNREGTDLEWADTHHPAISETAGEYDGRWAYIQDRANGRMAMIDLRDFETKQIVAVPNMQTSHGGMFVTPDSEYVHISAKYPMPFPPGTYADLSEYEEKYRSVSSWMKIDPATGHVNVEESFQIELPPYSQDLADSGKLVSDGWGFIGSFNSEMATGGISEGGEPLEAGASKNNFDFLHAINWKAASEFVAGGGAEQLNGINFIDMETAVENGLLYLIPEPKSPHGADVDPSGRYIVVGGKLDPHVTIYDFNLIQEAIANEDFEGEDPFGIPILNFDSVVAGQVEVGAGPLHTQFDSQGHGYVSLFLASAVAKFTLGEDVVKTEEEPFTLVETIQVHYNIGHLVTAEGDTVSPDDNYLVALNKWSIDRYAPLGPLHPQNFQLIDLAGGLGPMTLLADMPIGLGEPHYVQIIKADKLNPLEIYEPGTDAGSMQHSEFAINQGEERVERNGNEVEIWMTATRSHFTPDILRLRQGDQVKLHITNIEQTRDATHGFGIADYNISSSLEPGEVVNFEFTADKAGAFNFYCTEFCSALHLEMAGWMLVEPSSVNAGASAPVANVPEEAHQH